MLTSIKHTKQNILNFNLNLSNYTNFQINTDKKISTSIPISKSNSAPTTPQQDIHQDYSQEPDMPNFPIGNTPPDTNYLQLIYLNYLANKSLNKKIHKLNTHK